MKQLLRGIILFFGLSLILSLFSCENQKLARLIVSKPDGLVSIFINNDQFKVPFGLVPGQLGERASIWFETNNGRRTLSGQPRVIKDNSNVFSVQWDVDGREVNLVFEKEGNEYQFNFSAQPAEDITGWGMALASTEDEYFTGLYERVVDGPQAESWKPGISSAMNLRGQAIDMLVKPTVSLYTPFYLSSNGYSLFIKGTWPGQYNFCKTDPERVFIRFEGPDLSGVISVSSDPARLVKDQSLRVGPTIVPPQWAFLPWRWRDAHENLPGFYDGTKASVPYNSMLVEDVLMMKAFDIPCGVYWVDRPWAKDPHGYADFEWDSDRFPRAKEMIEWLHKNDIKFLLWVAPWVTGETMYREAKEHNYDVQIKGAHDALNESNVALMDFTNPEACRWLQEKGIEKLLNQGVDGFKLDRAEELVPETGTIVYFDGRTAREVRNDYPVLYVKTFNESCRKIKGDDFVLIPRAGYSGSSKYSGFWGGDIGSEPEGLRHAIIAVQRCAVMGFPIWGSDIGGYWHTDIDREVTARWLAFGCFNPIMEFGPTENLAPWSMKKEPHYDAELIAIWRMYAKIHTALADYSHQLALEASQTGMPIVRPLFLHYPNQPKAWTEWQTFMYGPDILVSAIWEKGKKSVTCYLPAGDIWIDAWDHNRIYEGGQQVTVETPIERIPIFIRQGSSVDLGDLNALYVESSVISETVPNLKELQKEVN